MPVEVNNLSNHTFRRRWSDLIKYAKLLNHTKTVKCYTRNGRREHKYGI